MTVQDLIEVLMEMDPELPVIVEGCDCYGKAAGARVVAKGEGWDERSVLVTRQP